MHSRQPSKWIGNLKAAKSCHLKTSQFKKEIPKIYTISTILAHALHIYSLSLINFIFSPNVVSSCLRVLYRGAHWYMLLVELDGMSCLSFRIDFGTIRKRQRFSHTVEEGKIVLLKGSHGPDPVKNGTVWSGTEEGRQPSRN